MGTHVHKILSADEATMRGVCAHCGEVPLKRKNTGTGHRLACRIAVRRWQNTPAATARKKRWAAANRIHRKPYLVHRGTECEYCGFVAEHRSQLDVHHLDRNHANNDPTNLMTLCANCHRLEHFGPPVEKAA
jgi:5-methylcytosine-specific restriction endonuclease McrA